MAVKINTLTEAEIRSIGDDGQHQLAVTRQRIDVFLLEVNGNAQLF